jgi:hypothetical protein
MGQVGVVGHLVCRRNESAKSATPRGSAIRWTHWDAINISCEFEAAPILLVLNK